MIFPLSVDRPLRRPAAVTPALIMINAAVYAAMLAGQAAQTDWAREMVRRCAVRDFPSFDEPWRLIAYAFVHGGFWHVFGNMVTLWVFGPSVEDRLGRAGFLAFYLAGAAAAGLAHAAVDPAPVVGASGAIAAVTGAFLVFFALVHVRTLLVLGIVGIYEIPALWFIGLAIAKDLLFQGWGVNDGVARAAHLGGYLLGITLALALLALRRVPREPYDLFSMLWRIFRRSQIRQAAEIAQRRMEHGAPTAENGAVWTRLNEALRAKDTRAAAAAYVQLPLPAEGKPPAVPPRRALDLGNAFFAAGEHAAALRAYRDFLAAAPQDAQAPHVELMTAVLLTRYLDRPDEARAIAARAFPRLRETADLALLEALMEELGLPR